MKLTTIEIKTLDAIAAENPKHAELISRIISAGTRKQRGRPTTEYSKIIYRLQPSQTITVDIPGEQVRCRVTGDRIRATMRAAARRAGIDIRTKLDESTATITVWRAG
jgi:hypothetical protein